LIEVILDDIQKGDDRLYPPYIQMVAETLCREVDQHNPIISRKIYLEQLEGADNIIARYLIDRLNEFGSLRAKAEKVVVSLTTSTGGKAQKSLTELSQETEIAIDELKDIMCKMVDLRMARAVGENRYEIVHDYLGKIVDEELVKEEDRTIKFLEEQLNSFYQSYKVHRTPIVSPPFLAGLYRNRRRIRVDEEKYPLILCTILAGKPGLGWYWLRDLDIERIGEIIKGHLSHGSSGIRQAAVEALGKIARPEDKDQIVELLQDEDSAVRRAAAMVLGKIANSEDRDKIVKMLLDEDLAVRRAAAMVLGKIANSEDRGRIVEQLHDKNSDIRRAAVVALGKMGRHEDRDKIVEMLRDRDDYVRGVATVAFVEIVRPEDREKAVEMLHDKHEHVRGAAVKALGKIAKPEDMDKIVELLYDEDSAVRQAAVEALGKRGEHEVREYLLDLVADKAQGWGKKQTNFFEALSELDKRFYCPYFKEEGV